MNNLGFSNLNAKARHEELIRAAENHRRIKAIKGERPSLWQAILNRVRSWQSRPARLEKVSGSLEAGKTA